MSRLLVERLNPTDSNRDRLLAWVFFILKSHRFLWVPESGDEKLPNCAFETLFTILLWRRLIEDIHDYSCRIVFVVNYSFVSHSKKIQVDCKFTKRHTRSPNRFELFRLMRYRMYPVNKRSLSFVCLKPTYCIIHKGHCEPAISSFWKYVDLQVWCPTEVHHLKTSLDITRVTLVILPKDFRLSSTR